MYSGFVVLYFIKMLNSIIVMEVKISLIYYFIFILFIGTHCNFLVYGRHTLGNGLILLM